MMKHAMIFMVLALLLEACTPPSTPAPTPTSLPTIVPSDTLEPTPTLTPTASRTPEPTLPVTPTLIFFFSLPTATAGTPPTPAPELACQLVSQSIRNGTQFHPQEPFSNDWKLSNAGKAPWLPGNVDFAYTGGTKMYLYPAVQLQRNVSPGDTISLNVDMRAPNKPSEYSTFWSLRRGKDYFCRVRLTIEVIP
jgi:hypothetical protein